MSLRDRLSTVATAQARFGILPTDTEVERRSKAILTFLAGTISFLSFFWVVVYFLLGRPLSAVIPLGYSIASWLSLAYFARTRRYGFFRSSQLLFMLLLPFLLQATLGGFVPSSAVMLWAVVSPLGGLMFHGPRQSVPWFAAFLALTALFGAFDGAFAAAAPPMPSGVIRLFFVMNVAGVIGVIYAVLHYYARRLQEEQARADNLLLNILPGPIADRLKHDRSAIADGFAEVTVLFADIVDFTTRSAQLPPHRLVTLLNEVFSELDGLAERYGLEKIKTIGDAYMAVAGLPEPRADHAEAAAEMALAIRAALAARALRTGNTDSLHMRIGLNTGPVVAGVIGTKKFIYDLWGDTVNVASRMESQGIPDAIQVTHATYERLRDRYALEERGLIQVKGRGEMQTYLLTGRLASAAPRVTAAIHAPAAVR